jgi:hypothetical protein
MQCKLTDSQFEFPLRRKVTLLGQRTGLARQHQDFNPRKIFLSANTGVGASQYVKMRKRGGDSKSRDDKTYEDKHKIR